MEPTPLENFISETPIVKPRQPSNPLQPYLRVVAADTLDVLERGFYYLGPKRINIVEQVAESVAGTLHITPAMGKEYIKDFPLNKVRPKKKQINGDTLIEVRRETTMDAIQYLEAEGAEEILALNFASASKPGGGFLNGRTAQEEALARSSGLYSSLIFRDEMYLANENGDHFYTEDMIYSPEVPFFKDDFGAYTRPYYASVLTSPAPNLYELGEEKRNDANMVLYNRIHRVLATALHYGHDTLVLGAWGCGVFKHDPNTVAWSFNHLLTTVFKGMFERIVFAVYDRPGGDNITAFENVFDPQPEPGEQLTIDL